MYILCIFCEILTIAVTKHMQMTLVRIKFLWKSVIETYVGLPLVQNTATRCMWKKDSSRRKGLCALLAPALSIASCVAINRSLSLGSHFSYVALKFYNSIPIDKGDVASPHFMWERQESFSSQGSKWVYKSILYFWWDLNRRYAPSGDMGHSSLDSICKNHDVGAIKEILKKS